MTDPVAELELILLALKDKLHTLASNAEAAAAAEAELPPTTPRVYTIADFHPSPRTRQ